MDTWLKWLVAAACIIVIGVAGYYAWGEYKSHIASQERSRLAEERAVKSFCRTMLHDLERNETDDYLVGHVSSCINLGHVTVKEMQEHDLQRYLDDVDDLVRKPTLSSPAPVGTMEWLNGQ